MPSFTKLFVLAACVVAGLAVPGSCSSYYYYVYGLLGVIDTRGALETRCDEAQLVKSQTIKTSGGSVSVNSFSCAPRVSKRQSESSSEIVNLSGQICEISCNNDAGALPPAIDDCNHIREAIQIVAGVGAIDPTFNLKGFDQQELVFQTCAFYFNNNIPDEIEFDWSDFVGHILDIDVSSWSHSSCYDYDI